MINLASVLIEHPIAGLDRPFDYLIPTALKVIKGVRVQVPFASQLLVGYVVATHHESVSQQDYEATTGFELKSIVNVLDDQSIITDELQSLATHLAKETLSPLISVYQAMLPPSLKPTSGKKIGIKTRKFIQLAQANSDIKLTPTQALSLEYIKAHQPVLLSDFDQHFSIAKTLLAKNLITVTDEVIYRNPYTQDYPMVIGPKLTDDQSAAILAIQNETHPVTLLEGVTGSGKTEVYIQLALATLALGKDVLMVVPEISLTPQMVKRFKQRIGNAIAVLHSALSEGEKYDEYRRIIEGKARVVIGARSAIFAPLSSLGLIIIDEEHSESYKQDSTPRYHARLVAEWRANYHHAKVVLGSATPSLESKARAIKGVYGWVNLPVRIGDAKLPITEIIDMMAEIKAKNYTVLSRRLQTELQARIAKKEQAMILLNRRGHSPHMKCRTCGFEFKCPDCDIALIYHKDIDRLRCHYCGFEQSKPTQCPSCHGSYFQYLGLGTQKLQEFLQQTFPTARIARLDRDVMGKKEAMQKLLSAYENGEYDILVGTQMIAKGLDFPNVTLVGVIQAETGLSYGYRAAERTFQLLTQVSGRGGRGDKEGLTIIQTTTPDHYVMKYAANHDYTAFYKEEMGYRKLRLYPPYRYLVSLSIEGKSFDEISAMALSLKSEFEQKAITNALILGPTVPYVARLQGTYRIRLLVKYFHKDSVSSWLEELYWRFANLARMKLVIDFDSEEDA